jgi:glucose/arabinose dehydrogenase/chitodextrinase
MVKRVSAGRARLSLVGILTVISLIVFAGLVAAPTSAAPATPTFVQTAAREISSGTVSSVPFANSNTAGNLIVAYVVWNNSGAVTLTDIRGNAYTPVAPITKWRSSSWSSQVFYAKNIGGGANTVTATFGTAIKQFGVVYIHEYAGVDKVNPFDATASAVGSSSAMNSGSATTANANDLIFGAGASLKSVTASGSGFTSRSTAFDNITEDKVVSTVGSYNATATQNSNVWVMHMVAFRADPGVPDTSPPSAPTGLTAVAASSTQVNLAWMASTDNVGVTGYRVFRNGAQVGTPTTTSFQDTGLAPATTYTYTVSAVDGAGNVSPPSASASATTPSPPPPDTTPPTVSITAPAPGSTVSSAVTVTANAADNVGVVGVQFLLDGANLDAEDTTSPYSTSWDTTTAANGSHTLSARARDAAGNVATAASTAVTVNNGAITGLAAGYAFDEGSGTSAADASGHGITGTLTNGPGWTTGKFGAAVSLDGGDDYVDLGNPTALQMTGSMTIGGWIFSTAFPGDDAAIVSRRDGTGRGYQLDTTVDNGPRTVGFKLTNGSGGDMLRYGATTLQLNNWYYVTGVYNAATSTLDVYLNGQLDNGVQVGAITGSQQGSSSGVSLGRRSSGGFNFNGRFDDIRIYNRALTAAEIQAAMNTPLGSSGPNDPNPPTVSITAPANNAQVSDIVTVTANAADDVGVAGVTFLVDGTATGGEDTTAPYGLPWDTRSVVNGAHTLTARARDAAGNTTVSSPVTVNVTNTNFFQNEVLATGFDLPTAFKFMPDGRMLVVQLQGTVRVLPPPYTQPDPTPFLQITNIGSAGVQQGVYDLALDPAFATNHFFYVFYTLGSPNRDRLSRFTANATNTGTVAGSELVLYQDPQDANAEHHGGAINFGNDGKLYFTTGEHFDAAAAQSLSSPRGKIHRINKDGTVPTDNPFYDGAGPHVDSVWALGLRNPYRAFYDAPSGRLFVGDVGGNDYSTATEEIDVGAAGANYGWPNCESNCGAPYTNGIYSYPHNGRDAAVTGGFVYHGTQFPASYQGSYFFADYTQNWIKRLTFDANGNVNGVLNFEPPDGSVDGPYGDIVYLTEGPDGALYYLDLGYSDISGQFGVSKIRRIRYTQSNQAPVAVAAANPTTGVAPLAVSFSSAGSLDPEGQPITYQWSFGDNTTSTQANPSHTYTQSGAYTVRLTVSDGVNSTVSTPVTISVGSPPTATITSPQDGITFVAGQVISFSGDATDPDDGPLPASAFTWNIDFLHEGHVHPGTPITGVKSGTFTIPTTGHDFSGFTRYRIMLTVTDSTGLTASTFVTIFPTKVNLSFATSPPGLTLYLDGIAKTAPFVYDTLIGFNHTIEARDQIAGATNYTFASWSDGGARTHTIVVPSADQTYTATYTVSAPPPPPLAFVQVAAATPQSNQSSVSVTYPAAQTAGNTNVVAVGWNSATASVSSVADGKGNVYQLAAPLTRGSGLSQAIYYAKGIVGAPAAGNSVTVTFSGAVPFADLRVAEYAGIDPANPVDQTASASGTGVAASSGNVTTTAAKELLFGAGMTTGTFTGPATGYTTRIITNPDADIVVDRIVSATGTYSAGGNQSGSAAWVMQVVAFRGAAQ